MKQEINTEYAPEGYRAELAVKHKGYVVCAGCAFEKDPSSCDERPCCPIDRPDNAHVIFVKL